MKKLSLIIAAVFIFGVANTISAQRERAGGILHGAAVVGPVSGGDTENATHGVSLNIDEITLLDIEDGSGGLASSFTFNITPSDFVSEAGAAFNSTVDLTEATGNEAYLQYTTLVENSKYVKAEITSGSLPAGFNLNVIAATVSTGAGSRGSSTGMQTIPAQSNGNNSTGQAILENIGTGYTGNGSTNGSRLSYQLEITDDANISALTSGNFDLTITYTISE